MEMIDKSTIIAEIEDIESTAISGFNSTHSRYDEAGLDICHRLKHFINTLEVKEVDLVKEYDDEFFKDPVFGKLVNRNAGISIAKHFFELGTKTQYNSIGFQNIDDILKEKGVDPDSKEAKIIKEAYFVAIDKAFENFKKGE